jgi:hypothetical protein
MDILAHSFFKGKKKIKKKVTTSQAVPSF